MNALQQNGYGSPRLTQCPSNGKCSYEPKCSDTSCETSKGESCNTCYEDCGTCIIPEEDTCKNNVCEAKYGESCSSCPEDCGVCEIIVGYTYCGDGICNGNEYYPNSGTINHADPNLCYDCYEPTVSVVEEPEVEVALNIPEIFNNPHWVNEWTEFVPAEYIDNIPPDKIDVTKVDNEDKIKITLNQLMYETNFELIEDKSLLHPDVISQAISIITGLELKITLVPGSNILRDNPNKQIFVTEASLLKVKCDNSINNIEIQNINDEIVNLYINVENVNLCAEFKVA